MSEMVKMHQSLIHKITNDVKLEWFQLGMSILLRWLSQLIGAFSRAIIEYSLIYLKLYVLFKSNNAPVKYTVS